MIIILVIIFFLFFGILWSFTSRRFSPIPYFPTNRKDISLIVKSLLNKKSRVPSFKFQVIDLGAGTGTVIFPTALEAYNKKLPIKFVAIEIHPLLIFILHLKRLFHPNKNNIKIIRADIFNMDFNNLLSSTLHPPPSIFYLYVGREALRRLKEQLSKLPAGTRIISYMYPIEGKKADVELSGVHKIYSYKV